MLNLNNSNEINDIFFMKLALEEANKALKNGNLPVGAVIVCDNNIISKNRNQVNELKSEIAHAELLTILQEKEKLNELKKRCILYTTLEPCMMCLGTIIYAEIARLIIAAPAPKVGGLHLVKNSISYQNRIPEVEIGLLKGESRKLLEEYVNRTGLRHDLLEESFS